MSTSDFYILCGLNDLYSKYLINPVPERPVLSQTEGNLGAGTSTPIDSAQEKPLSDRPFNRPPFIYKYIIPTGLQ